MGLRCDKDGQEFGSESALSMHLNDKHGITDTTEMQKAITKISNSDNIINSCYYVSRYKSTNTAEFGQYV